MMSEHVDIECGSVDAGSVAGFGSGADRFALSRWQVLPWGAATLMGLRTDKDSER